MKIGIITLPPGANYGGILQAYALQNILEKMGHDVSIIVRDENCDIRPLWRQCLVFIKRVILKFIFHKQLRICAEQYDRKTRSIIRKHTQVFIDKYLHLQYIKNYTEINDSFDAFVIGSDQVWRPVYFLGSIENAFCRFVKNARVKRIAYAASFGVDKWEYTSSQTRHCKNLIKNFSGVSVRENSGIDLCKNHFNLDATWVLDPTMLLCIDDYLQLVKIVNTPKSPGTLLTYILDETAEKASLCQSLATLYGYVPFRVNSRYEDKFAPLTERVQPAVEQWLQGFNDAEFVITDSFHACVFSILFHKQFFVFGNAGRGMARFKSLLKMFDIEGRLITDIRTFDYKKAPSIDYQKVQPLLDNWKLKSKAFLEKSLA